MAVKQLPLSVNNSILLNRSLGCLFVGNSGVYPIERTKNTSDEIAMDIADVYRLVF